jgi:hypothetical protein
VKDLLEQWRRMADELLAESQAASHPEKRSLLAVRALTYATCRAELQAALYAEDPSRCS